MKNNKTYNTHYFSNGTKKTSTSASDLALLPSSFCDRSLESTIKVNLLFLTDSYTTKNWTSGNTFGKS